MREAAPGLMMKYLIALVSLLILTACAKPEILADQLVERDGVTYQMDSDEPFTGRDRSGGYHLRISGPPGISGLPERSTRR